MPVGGTRRDNPCVVPAAADVVSPELVLVSPPEVAARARRLQPDPVRAAPSPEPAHGRRAFALFYVVCIVGTLGPLLLAVVAR
jgi:hypothetical protein